VSDVFDASGLATSQWQASMDETGQGFAVNTTAAKKAVTHSGHIKTIASSAIHHPSAFTDALGHL
jgi:hypothetical protein